MTTFDLFVLLQTCMDSLSITDAAGVFRYTKETRDDIVRRLVQELRTEQRSIQRPDAPTPNSVCNPVEPLDFGEAVRSNI